MANSSAETLQISVPCLEVEQPIGRFYIGVMEASDLFAISYADVRRPEGRDIERYIGTQRDLSEGRVAELKKYVTTVDACFPTSIILAIESDDVVYSEGDQRLLITKRANAAKIIDGQHRIAGLENYNGVPFHVNVTVFIDMELEDQAMVFATINLKQTKVTKSLAYDLYEYATRRSPQKTCHNIAKLLNFRTGSPLRERIKILGKATGQGIELITQATVVDRLLRLVSKEPMLDKDRLKRGLTLERSEARGSKSLIFRDQFIDQKDAEIAKCVWNLFEAAAARWPKAWNNFDPGQILPRTTGFAALMRLLPIIWEKYDLYGQVPSRNVFEKYFALVPLGDANFTSEIYKPGSSGEAQLVSSMTV